MKATLAVLLSLWAVGASAEIVPARWVAAAYGGPNYRRYDCLHAKDALAEILSAVGARAVRADCSWSYGLSASWEALAPVKEGAVPAAWTSVRVSRSVSDLRACNIYSDVLEHLLENLPVRRGNLSVFCQTGSSFISADFQRLSAP
ncbi:MAG: hypothetical protein AAB320_07750 [Elusimicrobiota bacterium]